MKAAEILLALQPWVRAHTRTAWVPWLDDEADPLNGSRFGGSPWIPTGEAVPPCGVCEEPLRLLLQLALDELPPEARGALPSSGMVQAFYCEYPECEQDGSGWEPFSKVHLVRIIASDGPGAIEVYGQPFPVRAISGWDPAPDLPAADEQDELGLVFDYDFASNQVRVRCKSVQLDAPPISMDELQAEQVSQASSGDKLRGWPHWVQHVSYPRCPQCSGAMEYVFQLDSDHHLPFVWGDAGVAHLSQCAQHPEVLTLAWAGC